MKLKDLSKDTWVELDAPDTMTGGYPSSILKLNNADPAILHLFRDRSGHYHLAIDAPNIQPNHLIDPNVNGLEIQVVEYKFQNGPTSRFIDLTCSISGYLDEFTEVVREIAREILERKIAPLTSVENVIRNWLTFWGKASKGILSEKDQIGLMCELIVLEKLCASDPDSALQSWKGPLSEKHDFSFPKLSLEVKGTRRSTRVHTINGLEQLVPPQNKQLALISIQLESATGESNISLPGLIDTIQDALRQRPDLSLKFRELLSIAGYNPAHISSYEANRYSLVLKCFHEIDERFPKLVPKMFGSPLSQRISNIKYDIDLAGVTYINLDEVQWGELMN